MIAAPPGWQTSRSKDYDHSDSRYDRPGVFCLSIGLYIEVGCVFNVFFQADFEIEVGF